MRRTICFLPMVAFSVIAAAQAPTDPLEACAQKTDATARLACFDQEMKRRHAVGTSAAGAVSTGAASAAPAAHAAAAPAKAVAPETPRAGQSASAQQAASASHAEENIGLQGSELRKRQREQGVVVEAPKPIVAQVARPLSHPDHRYTFYLDNGQVWEQMDSHPGLFVDAHETVTISSGVLGAFFLENSRHQSVRVRRVY
jgi:hypothetical protein